MRLKRLVLQGFKSFKDRQVIGFDDGVTGIVGPNGCGKSNIVDALFWVMGGQSAKHLRGHSMKDLIFAGSSQHAPCAFAEVALVLDNPEGKHIHIGRQVSAPSEIQLSRKLYRDGETEYRINGEPCRLRDIQEVFMDTGSGAKSYSVIAQGEIDRLVQSRALDRRQIIEEVAGITKFKMRRRESMRKIEVARQNLGRLQDLQREVEKHLHTLKGQSQKAREAKRLKQNVRRLDLLAASHKVFHQLSAIREKNQALQQSQIQREGWWAKCQQLEMSLERERHQRDQREATLEATQKEYNEAASALMVAEEKLKHLQARKDERSRELEQRRREVSSLAKELTERERRREELREQERKWEQKREGSSGTSRPDRDLQQLKDKLITREASLSALGKELENARGELSGAERELSQNEWQRCEVLEVERGGQDLDQSEKELSLLREQLRAGKQKSADWQAKIDACEKNLRERQVLLEKKSGEFVQAESKLQSFREIKSSLKGAKTGVSTFLKEQRNGDFALFDHLVQTEERYAKGVQLLLRELMGCLISARGDGQAFVDWLQAHAEEGGDLWIPLRKATESQDGLKRGQLLPGAIPLAQVVQVPAAYADHLRPLFAGHYLVPQWDWHNDACNMDGDWKAMADFAGQVVVRNRGGGVSFECCESLEETQGAVERNNQISELAKKLESLSPEMSALKEQIAVERKESEAWQISHREHLKAFHQMQAKEATLNVELESLRSRRQKASEQRRQLAGQAEELQRQKRPVQVRVSELSGQYAELKKEVESCREEYAMRRGQASAEQSSMQSFEEHFQSLKDQIRDAESQIVHLQARRDAGQKLTLQWREEITTLEREIEQLKDSNQQYAGVLASKQELLHAAKDELGQLQRQMGEREEEVKSLTQKIGQAEKNCFEWQTLLAQHLEEEANLTRDIFERYRVDLRFSVGEFLSYSDVEYQSLSDLSGMYTVQTAEGEQKIDALSYQFSQCENDQIKEINQQLRRDRNRLNNMGEVNWQAMEDFERQKKRSDFLKLQERELIQSLEDLDRAIGHIDGKSKERFQVAFAEVNERFQKVFPIIFGGGRAQLRVNGDINDEECGVDIVAQPPGKKMQDINLMSGGEKALTALSLIFSIFLVKPSPFCLLDEVDAPLDDINVGRFNELLREMSGQSQFILITHNKKTMELNDTLYGITMQEPGVSKAVSVQLH